MARYLPVLSIVVTHEFNDGMPMDLRFAPAKHCAALMLREGLLLRNTPSGAEVWAEQRLPPESAETVPLAFEAYTSDSRLAQCTAWPVATPLRFVSVEGCAELQPETLAGSGASRFPLFSVELDYRPGEPTAWRLALAAKKIHWKYFFSGSLAAKKLAIVDLDATDGGDGIRFAPSSASATEAGTAFTSEAPLPIKRLPQQRLQLREEGATGKVLIRRLPNANIEKLGKERGRDGMSMIVAEIYIHQ